MKRFYAMKTTFSIALGILSPVMAISAQSLSGRIIVDAGRVPLRHAVVELMTDGASKWVDSTSTDTTGVFYLSAPQNGQYYVQIVADGFANVLLKTPALALSSTTDVQREFIVPLSSLIVSLKQPETPARHKGSPPIPKYPPQLEQSGLEGSVLARFIVDTTGRVVPGSFTIVRSDHPDFSQAVRGVVFRMVFEPARISNRPVRQVVEETFQFRVHR